MCYLNTLKQDTEIECLLEGILYQEKIPERIPVDWRNSTNIMTGAI